MTPLETLRALGTGNEPPAEAKERVAGALFATIETAAAAAGTAAIAKHTVSPSLRAAATPLLGGVAGTKLLLVAAGIWLMGGVTGAAIYRAFRLQEVRVVYIDRSATPVVAGSVDDPKSALGAESAVIPLPSSDVATRAPDRPSASTAPENGSELARERALLDVARADAARGEPEQVLAAVAEHRQQFPHGRLTEEREALTIRALLSLGRTAEARQRAEAFRVSYPNSFLIPALESA